MSGKSLSRLVALAGTAAILVSCERTGSPAAPNDIALSLASLPPFPAPGSFVAVIDNAFFPLIPGTGFVYSSDTDEGQEIDSVQVTKRTRVILGVHATVVHDRVFLDGSLSEDTFDWYAQDGDGNVWYLGEDSCEVDQGQCVSKEGSWEAGVDGAEPGIIMWADPAAHQGETYQQEFLAGVAEDVAKVLDVNSKVSVPFGSYTGCLHTLEWTPLERNSREDKFYCRNVGLVEEVQPSGGRITNELVNVIEP